MGVGWERVEGVRVVGGGMRGGWGEGMGEDGGMVGEGGVVVGVEGGEGEVDGV